MGVFAAHDQTFLGATVGRRWKLFRPFVQDNWRVTNNLTVNVGLAWAFVTPETEVENRQANFDSASLTWFVPSGSPGGCSPTAVGAVLPFPCVATNGRVGIQFDKTALEPRIGLAWKPMGSLKTAIRAGYAIYHDSAWNQGGQGTLAESALLCGSGSQHFRPQLWQHRRLALRWLPYSDGTGWPAAASVHSGRARRLHL